MHFVAYRRSLEAHRQMVRHEGQNEGETVQVHWMKSLGARTGLIVGLTVIFIRSGGTIINGLSKRNIQATLTLVCVRFIIRFNDEKVEHVTA